jgi:hypothetical protein
MAPTKRNQSSVQLAHLYGRNPIYAFAILIWSWNNISGGRVDLSMTGLRDMLSVSDNGKVFREPACMDRGLKMMYTGRAVGYTAPSPADQVGWERLGDFLNITHLC